MPFIAGYILLGATGTIGGISDPTSLVKAARAMRVELGKSTGDAMLAVLTRKKGFRSRWRIAEMEKWANYS